MYDCADYRRHAEIGGYYSVDFIAYRPRRNCHFADATLCARAGISGESVSYYRFCGRLSVFYLDSAPAPTIVVLFAIVFIAVFIYATWRDRRNEIVPEAQG